MSYKSKKSKATDIPYKVKEAVWERDNHSCIYCGKTGYGVMPNAHFIPRSKGGLGVEENVVTLCQDCHYNYDFGGKDISNIYRKYIRNYLSEKYEDWREEDLVYEKKI
jgi:5-methylcytosine-specific restriction endonuclease McrA